MDLNACEALSGALSCGLAVVLGHATDPIETRPPGGGSFALGAFGQSLAAFREFGTPSRVEAVTSASGRVTVPAIHNEFWTARQRQADSLHEVSYRACFKPQLPRFFVERLTAPGARVYDPFMGRGTTVLEAALCGRRPAGRDVNPLSRLLVEPRLRPPPSVDAVGSRLATYDLRPRDAGAAGEDLLAFYHPDTLATLVALRAEFAGREASGTLDDVDRWIRMVALNRLTGHSPGFFSVYTMPPNQAVSAASQRRINARRDQRPEPRDVSKLILRKTKSLLSRGEPAARARAAAVAADAVLETGDSRRPSELEAESVALVVTSPPFLDVVQYAADNWLRCWFAGIDAGTVPLTVVSRVPDWATAMTAVLAELRRLLEPGGHVAFEVGEVRKGSIRLDEVVLDCGLDAGLRPELVVVHEQEFTKTANCWGVTNNRSGTNTNRIVVLSKAPALPAPDGEIACRGDRS